MIYGLDFLGLPKYADVAVREFPAGWALGAFANTFGDAFPVVREIVRSGRCPHVRMQLLWSDSHSFSLADMPLVISEAKRYNKLAGNNPKTKFELSVFCEHNIPNPDPWLDQVAAAAPNCRIVNTPYKGALSRKYKNEVHGSHPRPKGPYNYSYDGTSCVDADVMADKRQYRNSEVFFFWIPQFNQKKNATDPTPRPQRKVIPTSGQIDSVIYLHNHAGAGISLPSNFLWKSHADQHAEPYPEPRASKPVLICPVKADRFELVADNGQVVDVLPYYGPFADGRSRYYLGDFGYQVSEKALRIQGHPVLQLRSGRKIHGKVNPAFRAGNFRE
jgi:hypothetical protein